MFLRGVSLLLAGHVQLLKCGKILPRVGRVEQRRWPQARHISPFAFFVLLFLPFWIEATFNGSTDYDQATDAGFLMEI